MNLPSQTTVLQVSDTHLSPDFAAGTEMWTAAVRYIEKTRPDLVIHTGDVVHDDPDCDRDHEFAAFQMRRLSTPWRIVPGNHDIGDSPPDPFRGLVSAERLERFRRYFGADRWSVVIGGWQLIGLNSLLFDNHLAAEEAEQWGWLEERLREADGRPVGVFMHKPPAINSLDEDLHVNKSIGLTSRGRLRALVEAGAVRLIGSGHLHEHVVLYSQGYSHGALLVGAPALGPLPAGTATWNLGLRCNGLVEYRFLGDTVRVRLLREADFRPA
ncbi:metallophosphoesterase family protein [Catenulispora rubra]|uniref:metallophosphoesterase family protein n=1 Tax=Catenulispora rubra TaxID=280293 RepID=UPI00189255D7|nr:metallophosphoesterase [Catenulispora rubra]